MAFVLQGVEVYRHTSTLASETRGWCVANATLAYSGTSESFNDTGLDASTHYYYKIFAKYYDNETETYAYSSGAVADATTKETQILYQQWSNYPQSPVLTANYPHQCITSDGYYPFLCVTTGDFYKYSSTKLWANASGLYFDYSGGNWVPHSPSSFIAYSNLANPTHLKESNVNVYNDSSLTTVYFYKTTP